MTKQLLSLAKHRRSLGDAQSNTEDCNAKCASSRSGSVATVATSTMTTATFSSVPETPISALVTSALLDEKQSSSTQTNTNSTRQHDASTENCTAKQIYIALPLPLPSTAATVATSASTTTMPLPPKEKFGSILGSDIFLPSNLFATVDNDASNLRSRPDISSPASNMAFGDQSTMLESVVETGLDAPVTVFLQNFRENGSEVICSAYLMKQKIRQNALTGALSTSLPEDVFSIVNTQLAVLDDYLDHLVIARTEQGDAVLVAGVLSIFRSLWFKQTHFRDSFLQDLEGCIAASNNFLRMVEKVEQVLQECSHKYPYLAWFDTPIRDSASARSDQDSISVLRRESGNLIALYGSDAVLAARKSSSFVMKTIETSSIPKDLFSGEWEDTWIQNEVAVSLILTCEDFLGEIHNWYCQDFMYHKTIVALVQSTVSFYVKCMVQKAGRTRRRRHSRKVLSELKASMINNAHDSAFKNVPRAITRMMYDVEVFRDYFGSIAKRSTYLSHAVARELSILSVLVEYMWLAVGGIDFHYQSKLEELMKVLHKRVGGHIHVTQSLLSDLWALALHEGNKVDALEHNRIMSRTTAVIQTELTMAIEQVHEQEAVCPWKTPTFKHESSAKVTGVVTFQEFLKNHYDDATIFQSQASQSCDATWDIKSITSEVAEPCHYHVSDDDAEDGNGCFIGACGCCTALSLEGDQWQILSFPLGMDPPKQRAKDLLDRIHAFQQSIFPPPMILRAILYKFADSKHPRRIQANNRVTTRLWIMK